MCRNTMYRNSNRFPIFAFLKLIFIVGFCLSIVFLPIGCNMVLGINGFGPERIIDARVNRLYVDHQGQRSHYMVGTDEGVFEVENGWLLVWNADEIYSSIQEGHRYRFITKGNKFVTFWVQEYPYVLSVKPLE